MDAAFEIKESASPSLADASVVSTDNKEIIRKLPLRILSPSFLRKIDSSQNSGSPAKVRTTRDSGVCLSNRRDKYVDIDLPFEEDDLEEI